MADYSEAQVGAEPVNRVPTDQLNQPLRARVEAIFAATQEAIKVADTAHREALQRAEENRDKTAAEKQKTYDAINVATQERMANIERQSQERFAELQRDVEARIASEKEAALREAQANYRELLARIDARKEAEDKASVEREKAARELSDVTQRAQAQSDIAREAAARLLREEATKAAEILRQATTEQIRASHDKLLLHISGSKEVNTAIFEGVEKRMQAQERWYSELREDYRRLAASTIDNKVFSAYKEAHDKDVDGIRILATTNQGLIADLRSQQTGAKDSQEGSRANIAIAISVMIALLSVIGLIVAVVMGV